MKKASVVLSTLILLSSVAGCTATNETTARETRNDDTDVTIVQSDEPDETEEETEEEVQMGGMQL